jgi:hypothetical protein
MTANGHKTRNWSESDVPDRSGRVAVIAGSNTELTRNLPAIFRPPMAVLGPVLFQSAAMDALPTLRAATEKLTGVTFGV